MQVQLSGLASGFDWNSMVDQLTDLERLPQKRLLLQQSALFEKKNTYSSLSTELTVFKGKLEGLATGDIFDQRSVGNSDDTVALATVDSGALQGTYDINVTQLSTASSQVGSLDVGSELYNNNNVNGLTLSSAPFSTAVTDGYFTVNNTQITVSSSDSLGSVLTAIENAIGNSATAEYNQTTDKIEIDGRGTTVVFGSSTDTSNFLQVAELYNNGTDTVSSANKLGRINTSVVLDDSNFDTAVSDGGSGAGSFKINGVSISFDTSVDSLENVMDRINASSAGVIATYDSTNDRLQLINKSTGDLGVSMSDETGNFLAASGLSSGTLSRGNNMQFSINGGGTLTSFGNTADESLTGVNGLQLTALKTGSTTITIDSDHTAIQKGITDLIDQYNKVQTFIDTHAGSSTDSDGKVQAGVLFGESEVQTISSQLRSLITGQVASLSAGLNEVNDVGVTTSGYSDSISLSDSGALNDALVGDLDKVKTLFQDSTDGIAVKLLAFVESQLDDEGVLSDRMDNLNNQATDIDDQVERLEGFVQMRRQAMIDSFVAMESAQQKINQQMQFIQSRFG
jgi:flagellar hook-associated protein 2